MKYPTTKLTPEQALAMYRLIRRSPEQPHHLHKFSQLTTSKKKRLANARKRIEKQRRTKTGRRPQKPITH